MADCTASLAGNSRLPNTIAVSATPQSGEIGIALPDPVAMAIALDPSICTDASNHRVEIECASELTRGQTVVDRLNVADDERNRGVWSTFRGRPKNVSVCWSIHIAKWKALLYRSLT